MALRTAEKGLLAPEVDGEEGLALEERLGHLLRLPPDGRGALEVARRQLALQDNVDGTDFATLGESLPVPVNVTVQYLRSATTKDCHVRAEILKLGRRSNTVLCRMWQEDEAKPVASMTGIFVRPA